MNIGTLVRNGKTIYYVYPVGGAYVEAASKAGLTRKLAPKTPAPFRVYTVHVQPKHPAWDEKNGWDVQATARSKKEAVANARRQTRDAGHTGVIYFKATEVQS